MTSAELKTLRESLGLTAQWLADNACVRLRTAQYWESGHSAVPDDVAEILLKIDRQFSVAASHAIDIVAEQAAKHGALDVIDLYRYRDEQALWADRPDMQGLPVSCHAALLNRCRLALEALGNTVRITYKDELKKLMH